MSKARSIRGVGRRVVRYAPSRKQSTQREYPSISSYTSSSCSSSSSSSSSFSSLLVPERGRRGNPIDDYLLYLDYSEGRGDEGIEVGKKVIEAESAPELQLTVGWQSTARPARRNRRLVPTHHQRRISRFTERFEAEHSQPHPAAKIRDHTATTGASSALVHSSGPSSSTSTASESAEPDTPPQPSPLEEEELQLWWERDFIPTSSGMQRNRRPKIINYGGRKVKIVTARVREQRIRVSGPAPGVRWKLDSFGPPAPETTEQSKKGGSTKSDWSSKIRSKWQKMRDVFRPADRVDDRAGVALFTGDNLSAADSNVEPTRDEDSSRVGPRNESKYAPGEYEAVITLHSRPVIKLEGRGALETSEPTSLPRQLVRGEGNRRF